jgi:hypothetical protein
METTALNAFLAIVGAMLVPIIPIEYLQVFDRVHDLSPKSTKPKRERDEILVDLSPDYSEMVTDEIVMLEPVNIRRKHGVR